MMSWLPENISLEGEEIDFLFYISYYLTVIVFIGVAVVMAYFIIKYRAKPGVKAKYTHGNTRWKFSGRWSPPLSCSSSS